MLHHVGQSGLKLLTSDDSPSTSLFPVFISDTPKDRLAAADTVAFLEILILSIFFLVTEHQFVLSGMCLAKELDFPA